MAGEADSTNFVVKYSKCQESEKSKWFAPRRAKSIVWLQEAEPL